MHIMTFVEASSDKAAQDNCCLQCAGQKKKIPVCKHLATIKLKRMNLYCIQAEALHALSAISTSLVTEIANIKCNESNLMYP